MSDQPAAEVATKKKSKIPILLVLFLVLIGGGFFALKMKGGGSKTKEKPKVEMGEKDTDLEEFLTNTAISNVYVRAKISVRLRKGYEETKLKENMSDLRDAVIQVLNATQPTDITDASKRTQLKHLLAYAMNVALVGKDEAKPWEKPDKEDSKGKSKDKEKEKDKSEDDKPAEKSEDRTDDWDSQTGPILKVRFSNLATQ